MAVFGFGFLIVIFDSTVLLLTVGLILAGCQSLTKPFLPVLSPADLTQPCDPLPKFTGKDVNKLIDYTVAMAYTYHQCEAKQIALAKWSKEINQ